MTFFMGFLTGAAAVFIILAIIVLVIALRTLAKEMEHDAQ